MFLALVGETGSVSAACATMNIGRSAIYDWKADDSDFAARLEAAQDRGTDWLEDQAVRRAAHGMDEPVFYKGKIVGYIKRYSDTLLMFTLKGRRPERWKERTAQELTGPNGGPVQIEGVRDEFARRIARLAATGTGGGSSGGDVGA